MHAVPSRRPDAHPPIRPTNPPQPACQQAPARRRRNRRKVREARIGSRPAIIRCNLHLPDRGRRTGIGGVSPLLRLRRFGRFLRMMTRESRAEGASFPAVHRSRTPAGLRRTGNTSYGLFPGKACPRSTVSRPGLEEMGGRDRSPVQSSTAPDPDPDGRKIPPGWNHPSIWRLLRL